MSAGLASALPGTVFQGRPRTLSLARILAFSGGPLDQPGWPEKNLHTDEERARAAGLDQIIASGTQFQGILLALLVDLFGPAWHKSGILDVKITRSVKVGDRLQPKAKVQGRESGADGERVVLDVWCETDEGVTVLAGTASGRLG